MNAEDLKQIRELMREEILAVKLPLENLITSVKESLEREMETGFKKMEHRFDQVTNRLDRIDTRLAAQALEVSGVSSAIAASERTDANILGTQHAQQRAIDDLVRRVAELERKLEAKQ